MKRSHCLATFVVLALIGSQARSAAYPTLPIGSQAPDFKLKASWSQSLPLKDSRHGNASWKKNTC